MNSVRKRTIDRRRRPKAGTAAAALPLSNIQREQETESEDSSVDVPKTKTLEESSDMDSSIDVKPPNKERASATHVDSNEEQDTNLNEGDASANEQSGNSSKDESPPAKKKKKTSGKKKVIKVDKKQAKGRSKKAPSEDEEELENLEESESSAGEQSNVSEFDPDALESEESEASWDEDEEDVKPKTRGRPKKQTARGGKRKKSTRGRRKKQESDNSEASWNIEEEQVKPKAKRGRPKRSNGTTRQRRAAASRSTKTESEDSWNSDKDDEGNASYKTPRSSKRSGRFAQLKDSSDEEEEDDGPRRSTPSRKSASKALARISDNVKKDANVEEDEEAQDEMFPMTRNKRRKKKKNDDDDDEFDPDAEDSPEEEEEEDDLGDEDSSDDGGAKKHKAVNVDVQMESFLTADSSEDENAPNPSPMLNIKSTPRSRRRRPVKQDVDSFASSESEGDKDDTQHDPTLSSPSPHMPACPSEIDSITMDPLPDKHLCYFSPDFQSRQCFALETLHKIALSSTLRGLDGKPTFLQPPHFRSPASDDFVDQIASRFGRSALDLTGDFYNRGVPNRDGYRLTIGANLADEETFQERLNDYISNLMGSQDIYCCPLCYIESHKRLEKRLSGEGEDESSDEEVEDDDPDEPGDDERGPVQLWHDPMTVLGFPDHEKYLLASTFCFTKIADVKRHLREVHHVDTKILDSNDLFARFKVRVGDGLLQRYIEKTARKGRTYQGDMRRYWNLGNNQTFVYLIHLMKRRTIGGDMVGEVDSQVFFRSFENRAKHTWEVVSAPYHKATREEVNEFIENEDVEEEDVQSHFAMHREIVNPADEIAQALKQRRLSQGGQLDSDESSDEEENKSDATSEDDDANPDNIPGYYSEEEEEEDDWVKSRLPRPGRQNRVSPPTSNDLKPAAKGKRLGKARDKARQGEGSRENLESQDSKPPPAKKAKRSRFIIESDSDE